MFKKLKENKKKGFTLVELIVVLVILAILAALLIPALTKYIDKAKNKSIVAETRQAVMAAQTLADEKYATLTGKAEITLGAKDAEKDTIADDKKSATIAPKSITDLSEVKGTIESMTVDNGKVTTLVYTNSGKKCTYNPDNAAANSDGDYNVEAATK